MIEILTERKKKEKGNRYAIFYRLTRSTPYYRVLRSISTLTEETSVTQIHGDMLEGILDLTMPLPLPGVPKILENQVTPFITGLKSANIQSLIDAKMNDDEAFNAHTVETIYIVEYEPTKAKKPLMHVRCIPLSEWTE